MNKIHKIENKTTKGKCTEKKNLQKNQNKKRKINMMNLLIEGKFSHLHRVSFLRTIPGVT